MPWGSTGYVRFPAQSFCGARARSRGTTSRTRSNSFRCGASTCSSRTASRAACKGPPSSRTGRRCGSASASVADFLLGLFRQGALQGDKPEQAFFVRCDASTMTRQDVDRGIVKLVVGFAPLRPAEFVIIGIGTLARDQPCPSFVSRHYRIRAARYTLRVMWDGEAIAGVRRVRGLGQLTELVSVRDGGDPNASRVIVGPTKFEPVALARGITRDDAFEKWAQAIRQGEAALPRKDVRIELHDGERRLTVAWVLKGALPVKIEAPDLNADSGDVAMEELTLAYEGLEFDHDPPC